MRARTKNNGFQRIMEQGDLVIVNMTSIRCLTKAIGIKSSQNLQLVCRELTLGEWPSGLNSSRQVTELKLGLHQDLAFPSSEILKSVSKCMSENFFDVMRGKIYYSRIVLHDINF